MIRLLLLSELFWPQQVVTLWISCCAGPPLPINSYFQQEFPSLPAAGDQEKSGKDKEAAEDGSGANLRPQSKCELQIVGNLLCVELLLVPCAKKID